MLRIALQVMITLVVLGLWGLSDCFQSLQDGNCLEVTFEEFCLNFDFLGSVSHV